MITRVGINGFSRIDPGALAGIRLHLWPARPDRDLRLRIVSAPVATQNLTESLRIWQEKYPGVPVRHEVVHGHPARVLASYTARADLVVIGRHGGHATGPAIGAIQHGVLSHAHGPVAIVPANG